MPKKFQGENTKAAAARARKTEAKATERAREEQAKEDAYWQDDDKHAQRKTQRKNDQEQRKQQELERKQANRQAYEREMNTLTTSKQKQQQQTAKVTQAQIERERQLEEIKRKEAERAQLLEQKKIVVQDESETLEENVNRMAIAGQSARTVEEAISVLKQTNESQQQDRHPEKRVRAAYAAFEERWLTELKQEEPTLRLSQLKQLVKKEWTKSTENPLNQQNIGTEQQ